MGPYRSRKYVAIFAVSGLLPIIAPVRMLRTVIEAPIQWTMLRPFGVTVDKPLQVNLLAQDEQRKSSI